MQQNSSKFQWLKEQSFILIRAPCPAQISTGATDVLNISRLNTRGRRVLRGSELEIKYPIMQVTNSLRPQRIEQSLPRVYNRRGGLSSSLMPGRGWTGTALRKACQAAFDLN